MAKVRSRNRERTRQRILDAASTLLAKGGAGAFSVNRLAARARVGKPLIYRYFGGFPGVLDALVQREAERWKAREASSPAPANLPVSLAAYRKLRFGRWLAGDSVVRGLYRTLLRGGLSRKSAGLLLGLLPTGEDEDKTASAFLLAGIAFIVLVKDHCESFGGIGLKDARELVRLEGVFLKLAESLEP